jgi:hypothetical protein
MDETRFFQTTGESKKKKGKRKKTWGVEPWAPPESSAAAPIPSAPSSSPIGSGSNRPGTGPVTARPTPPGTGTTNYSQGINNTVLQAPSGSLAASIGNPAMHSVAMDPYSQVNQFYSQQGLGSDSNSAQLAYQLWNPAEKRYGILGGEGISTDIDAINFGEQLLQSVAMGKGGQLDPMKMLKNVLAGLSQEAGRKEGAAITSVGNKLTDIVHDPDPASQLNSLMGVIQGVLKGTMPDDSMTSLINQISRAASSFISRWQTSSGKEMMNMEKSGDNMFRALTNFLSGILPG